MDRQENSGAVQKHLEILQSVITRMAENSRYCKVWCVTLVAASLVLVARTGEPRNALIALVPTVLFYVLDAYYLALERRFRSSYDRFVAKVHTQSVEITDLYVVRPQGPFHNGLFWALFLSFAVLPFYAAITATVVIAWLWVL